MIIRDQIKASLYSPTTNVSIKKALRGMFSVLFSQSVFKSSLIWSTVCSFSSFAFFSLIATLGTLTLDFHKFQILSHFFTYFAEISLSVALIRHILLKEKIPLLRFGWYEIRYILCITPIILLLASLFGLLVMSYFSGYEIPSIIVGSLCFIMFCYFLLPWATFWLPVMTAQTQWEGLFLKNTYNLSRHVRWKILLGYITLILIIVLSGVFLIPFIAFGESVDVLLKIFVNELITPEMVTYAWMFLRSFVKSIVDIYSSLTGIIFASFLVIQRLGEDHPTMTISNDLVD